MESALKPYTGPPATPETFPEAFPQYEQAIKKGVNNLDQESQTSLNELMSQMRSTPPKPATIINLHPWPLTFGSTNIYLRGLSVPACNPGQPFAHYHIRGYRREWEYNENGSLKFKAILPIRLAAEFVREFSNKDAYGGGVIIYEGEGHPDKVDLVETYDAIGRPITTSKQVVVYDEENRPIQEIGQAPVKRKLSAILAEAVAARNKFYMQRVQKADHDYRLPDGRGKWLLTDTHRLMAETLFAEGVIAKVPDWNLASRFEQGISDNNCKACGHAPQAGAYKCMHCGNILNVLEAYRDFAIEYGHAKMEMLTSDEWEEVEEIKAQRETAKLDKQTRPSKGKKAKPEGSPNQ